MVIKWLEDAADGGDGGHELLGSGPGGDLDWLCEHGKSLDPCASASPRPPVNWRSPCRCRRGASGEASEAHWRQKLIDGSSKGCLKPHLLHQHVIEPKHNAADVSRRDRLSLFKSHYRKLLRAGTWGGSALIIPDSVLPSK